MITAFVVSTSVGASEIKSSDIKFPGNYYTTEIKSCSAINDLITFSNERVFNAVDGLIGFDWHKHHHANSSSMDISHRIMTKPMGNFMVATHNAITTNNQTEIDIAIDFLVELARTETLLGFQKLCLVTRTPTSW